MYIMDELEHSWTFYTHLPHDTDWSLDSYKKIYEMKCVCDMVSLIEHIPRILIQKCMLFIMKEDTKPLWEDPRHNKGGFFCFKIHHEHIETQWKYFVYYILGCSINEDYYKHITGISISPKKHFCIIKIWVDNKDYNDISVFNLLFLKNQNNGIFKPLQK